MSRSLHQSTALAILFFMGACCSRLPAQQGVSSLSMGMSRAGMLPIFDEIRIEEYINYHQHDIPRPEGDRKVALDLRWSRVDGDRAVVQIGLATPLIGDPGLMPPLNLVLVIDRSGSMSGDRIENVRKSLVSFVERLRPADFVSIVGFSNEAQILLKPCQKSDRIEFRDAIERVTAGGSTNLHAGLMLGYKIAEEHFDDEKTNRVIILTDGIANVGKTDPAAIAAESKLFNRKGISLSTIGLGRDLNQDLLRELADTGRGLIHFVNDSVDIEKTFIAELDSLLAPAACDVRLKIESIAPPRRVFGYETRKKGNGYRLDDLNHGATQVLLSEWDLKDSAAEIRVSLQYRDAVSGKKEQLASTITLDRNDTRGVLADPDLRKNYVIAILAEGIQRSVKMLEEGNRQQAIRRLSQSIRFARNNFPKADQDIARMRDIASDYRSRIQTAVKSGH